MMANKTITKNVEDMTIEIASNGFVIEYAGYDDEDKYVRTKLVFRELNQLQDHIAYIVGLGRD
jgi:hypothetical protein